MVREYMLQQLTNTEDDTLLMNVVIEQMTCDSDPEMGGAVQLMYIIKDLLDPENMLGAVNNKQEKTDFLNYFYKHCMHVLIGVYIHPCFPGIHWPILQLINQSCGQQ